LHGVTVAVNALKAMFIVLAASALILVAVTAMLPKRTAETGVRLNELLLNPADAGWDEGFIELYNAGGKPVNMDGWTVHTKSGSRRLFGEIKPGEYRVIYGDIASGEGEAVLRDAAGGVVDTYTPGVTPTGVSVGRTPDGSGGWSGLVTPTPGAPNTAPEYTQPTPTTLPEVQPPECMKAEYTAIGDGLEDIGFGGGETEFCAAFEKEMLAASPYVRKRVNEITDPKIKADIAYTVAERKAAGDREERIVSLVVSDSELLDSVKGLLGDELYSMGLDGELEAMNSRFKRMMFDVLLNGTKTERRELRLQLKFYLESRESGGGRVLTLDPDEVRVMLSRGDDMQEILVRMGV